MHRLPRLQLRLRLNGHLLWRLRRLGMRWLLRGLQQRRGKLLLR